MNIVVLIKQTFDTEAKIAIKEGKIVADGVTQIINPYDEFALEEALRIKEKSGGDVLVVSAGGEKVKEALRSALAMGADRALLVETEGAAVDEGIVASALAKAISGLSYNLVLSGWKAIDDNSAQVGGRVAETLGLPQVNVVTQLTIEDGKALAVREVEGGTETVEVPLPALITAQRGLNEPRYPNMRGIMQAKKKELKVVTLSELGVSGAPQVAVKNVVLPPAKQAGKLFRDDVATSVAQLVQALRNEAKVI
ncbi:electron transfer flavoprotein subunit beta/FixA family protein [Heliophilum fasciatum]|uniref:Electron transfer flavoprotein subunit beta n=1 Tax=Heliophilum fasciatum TaxID=35700 RepID=A0A4V2SW87_9FIRM|nr:electron transfer flavoprotein subunit beta/FixA family protein [Heliophilum fasciatum]MCW2279079.1 electron transfer flavoprotein beta subunit [Heliophilum fasciatum]TCP61476.1 electron transfer flavoprotein beta subunit [Heliophilum fasciatum]